MYTSIQLRKYANIWLGRCTRMHTKKQIIELSLNLVSEKSSKLSPFLLIRIYARILEYLYTNRRISK
jgi:hypothetical protein